MASNRIFPTVWNEYTGNCNVDIRTWKIWTNINVNVKIKIKQRKSVCCNIATCTPIYNDLNKEFLLKTQNMIFFNNTIMCVWVTCTDTSTKNLN